MTNEDNGLSSEERRARHLRDLLKRLVRAIGLLERGDATCCGVTLSQCHALGEVAAHEGLTPGELASRLGVHPSAATRITDALVREGLVRRDNDLADRRVTRLTLTTSGRTLWSRIEEIMRERSLALLRQLPADRQEAVLDACQQLVQILERGRYSLSAAEEGGICRGST